MKNIFLFFTALLFGSGAVYGQDTLAINDDEAKSIAIVSRLTRELHLDKQQRDQVLAVMHNRWKSMRTFRSSKKSIDHNSVNQQTLGDLQKILTQEQYQRLLVLRKERRKQKEDFITKNPGFVFSEEDKDLDF